MGNAAAEPLLEELVGADVLPRRYLARLRRLRPGSSGIVLYAGLEGDPADHGLGLENLVAGDLDWDAGYDRAMADPLASTGGSICCPGVADPTRVVDGVHPILVHGLWPADGRTDWRALKPRAIDSLLERIMVRFPDLRDRLRGGRRRHPQRGERGGDHPGPEAPGRGPGVGRLRPGRHLPVYKAPGTLPSAPRDGDGPVRQCFRSRDAGRSAP